MRARAHALLRRVVGEGTTFRPGQWEAIEQLVSRRARVLLVQRTGWGKSLVYFVATKLRREQGAGQAAALCIPSPWPEPLQEEADMTLESDDARAILLLCSHLGLPPEEDLRPLSPGEWNRLADELAQSLLVQATALLGLSVREIEQQLPTVSFEAERLARLLDREEVLSADLERLDSRGIWVLTSADRTYPNRLKQRLGPKAPPVLFGSGAKALFDGHGLAVVGSRNASPEALALAAEVGEACAQSGLAVVSGGARGIDLEAMRAVVAAGGTALGVLAEGLERRTRVPEQRVLLDEGRLLLTTPFSPSTGFSVGNAMGRNKLIYALADFALVVASDAEKGGTWAGAIEALRTRTTPVFAIGPDGFSEGTRRLLDPARSPRALEFPARLPCPPAELHAWLKERAVAAEGTTPAVQRALFR